MDNTSTPVAKASRMASGQRYMRNVPAAGTGVGDGVGLAGPGVGIVVTVRLCATVVTRSVGVV